MAKIIGQDGFIAAIEKFIKDECGKDAAWSEKVKASGKGAEDAAKYVVSKVKESRRMGFTDDEVFGMVKHFFDEGLEAPKDWSGCGRVVSNGDGMLSDADKKKARKEAIAEYKKEAKEMEMKAEAQRQKAKKEKARKKMEERKERERKEKAAQLDLFGFDGF